MKLLQVLNGASATTAASSVVLAVGDLQALSFAATLSSPTLAGTFTIQPGFDSGNGSDLVIWGAALDATKFPQSTVDVTATGSGVRIFYVYLPSALAQYYRLVWTPSAGTGTISAYALIKGSYS